VPNHGPSAPWWMSCDPFLNFGHGWLGWPTVSNRMPTRNVPVTRRAPSTAATLELMVRTTSSLPFDGQCRPERISHLAVGDAGMEKDDGQRTVTKGGHSPHRPEPLGGEPFRFGHRCQQVAPAAGSRLAAGHPSGLGLDVSEDAAKLRHARTTIKISEQLAQQVDSASLWSAMRFVNLKDFGSRRGGTAAAKTRTRP
jgi:hypothetical protein